MKKHILALSIGFILGAVIGGIMAIKVRDFFHSFSCFYEITPPELDGKVHYFGLQQAPENSRHHFFRREGFTDVDEYWSFELPKEQIKTFIDEYTTGVLQLKKVENLDNLKSYCWIQSQGKNDKNLTKYWFESFKDLDEIYINKRGDLFCGYSMKDKRIYLLNYNT